MGGTDEPSNLIELTVEEHSSAHRKLYEEHGHWQDKVAWQGLAGLIGHDDIMKEMWEARKGEGNYFYGKKHTEEALMLMSKNRKGKGLGPKKEGFADTLKESWKKHGHPRVGKTPWNKGKQGLQKQSNEQLLKKSKPIIFQGVEYISIKEAERQTGVSAYKIQKQGTFIATSK